MALRVWLPLNGDLHNQGLSDIEAVNNGATVNNSGKIGKCYSFDGSSKYISITNPLTDASEVSCAVWVKPLTNTSTNEEIINIGTAAGWNNIRFGILQRSVNQFVFHVSDGTNTIGSSCASGTIPVNQWIHIACTYKDKTLKMYLNGELVKTYTISFTPSFDGITNIGIGAAPNGAEKFTGYINDIRIWENHCLSPLEVKKISQGLVLHYRLSGVGGENLIPNITNWTKEANANFELQEDGYYKISSKVTNATRYGIYYDFVFPEPNIYTFSADVRTDYHIGIAPATDFKWTVNTINGNNKKRISYSITTTEENNKCRIYITSTKSYSTYIKNIKLEKGSYPTPWCPNSLDDEYSIMGLDDNIEYDCSGYGNNGTKVGNIAWDSDSPRYSGSYKFDGASRITTDTLPLETQSISLWIKPTSADISLSGGNYTIVFLDKQSQLACGFTYGNRIITYVGTNSGDAGSAVIWTNMLEVNEWNHIVILKTGALTRSTYINGELAPATSNNWWSATANELNIGCRNNSGYKHFWHGQISDFRAYTTLLSADDILNLYHLGGSIDSNGVFHTYEYVEG